MSDLTLIAENIRATMDEINQTQEAGENLRERVTHENYARFRVQMNELAQLHEDEMALDELADAIDRAFDIPAPEYRHASGHG